MRRSPFPHQDESLQDDEAENVEDHANVGKTYKVDELDEPIRATLQTTKFEVLLMVLNFSFRHGLTAVARNDLCKLINEVLGTECIPDSDY